jgi:aspartate kinase
LQFKNSKTVKYNSEEMKVLKFGGTSVGSAARMQDVAKLICDGEQKIVVLSAMSGTTNSLVEISDYFYKNNTSGALERINTLEQKYHEIINELYSTDTYKTEATRVIKSHFDYLRAFSKSVFTLFEEKAILAQGELLSTNMFQFYMLELGAKSVLLPALDFMRIDKNAEPDTAFIAENLEKQLSEQPDKTYYITQGYICRNFYGEIDNLQRGGSDYTASLIGAAIKAEEIQIWTDIDGMHNNDPRYVEGTTPVPYLHFEEAAELAYFGAKILHPTCILPAKLNNIPVRLLNTMEPKASGTIISMQSKKGTIQAVAAKDGITAIKIKSGRMLLAHGFLRKVFEIFESYQTSIDMITTSEVGVSVTIDNTKRIDEIVNNLKKLGTVTVDTNMVIICVVGDLPSENVGFQARAVNSLRDIPVRMISYGGSNYNISFLVKSEDKKRALNALSLGLFND